MVIFVPVLLLVYCSKTHLLGSGWFVALFFGYAFPYRMITDYYRLRSKEAIDKGEYREVLNPFYTMKYLKELYWV